MTESVEFELEAEELMMSSSLNDLVKLADDLGIDKKFWNEKPKLLVIKAIRKFFDVDDIDEKKKTLDFIVRSLKHIVTTGPLTGSNETAPPNNDSFAALINNSMFRRELKLQGQIGEAHQRDKISFISLMRQIREAKAKGYDEKEITSAILRAFTPGLSVRTYLETIIDLTLPRLLQILRTHFKEKSATELYQELSTMTQEPGEDANKFLIRALEVRQKVLFASETDEGVHYNPTLVQGLFLQTLEVGLIQEAIRTRIRPFLKPETSDEELIHQMGKAVSAETERGKRLPNLAQKQSKTAKVQGIESTPVKKMQPEKAPKNDFAQAVQALSQQMAELTAEVSQLKAQNNIKNPARQQQTRRNRCQQCQDKNNSKCNHCFLCGSEEHFARGCKKAKRQGNDYRLQQGGQL